MIETDFSKYYWKNDFITLRQPKIDDWEYLICNMYDNIGRFFFNEEIELPVDPVSYKQGHTDFVQSIDPNKYTSLAIENNDGKHIGVINIFGIDERNGRFGPIGIQINPADRKKGYGIAAYQMIGRYMFNERRMHKWNNGYMEENKASEALHKKLGFIVEGVQKDMYFHEGRYWNQVLCGMTEKEFFEKNI